MKRRRLFALSLPWATRVCRFYGNKAQTHCTYNIVQVGRATPPTDRQSDRSQIARAPLLITRRVRVGITSIFGIKSFVSHTVVCALRDSGQWIVGIRLLGSVENGRKIILIKVIYDSSCSAKNKKKWRLLLIYWRHIGDLLLVLD